MVKAGPAGVSWVLGLLRGTCLSLGGRDRAEQSGCSRVLPGSEALSLPELIRCGHGWEGDSRPVEKVSSGQPRGLQSELWALGPKGLASMKRLFHKWAWSGPSPLGGTCV